MSRTDNEPLQLFLDRLLVRSTLNSEERAAILGLKGERKQIKARHDIVKDDQVTSHACLIEAGLVGRFGITDKGTRQFVSFHIPGDMADLHSAVRPIGSGGLHALCDTIVLRIPHLAVRGVAARYPAIAEAFWRDCVFDTAIMMQWVVNVGRRNAPTRLAHLLCEMASRFGKEREFAQSYAFPLTQEQIADATALTSVHINRTLKSLRDLVTVKGGLVQIHDWAALAHVGDFDPSYLVGDTAMHKQKPLLSVVG